MNIPRSTVAITFSYWAMQLLLLFVNKWLLSCTSFLFDGPLLITWFTSLIVMAVANVALKLRIGEHVGVISWSQVLLVPPSGFFYTLMIVSSNLCLKYLNISAYYIFMSFTMVIFALSNCRFGNMLRVFAICFFIIVGYSVCIIDEVASGMISVYGVVAGLFASAFTVIYSMMMPKTMAELEGSVLRLILHNNFYVFILLPIPVFIFEKVELFFLPLDLELLTLFFWLGLISAGALVFSLAYITVMQANDLGPAYTDLSVYLLAICQTVLGIVVLMDYRTTLWYCGATSVFVGVALRYISKASLLQTALPMQTPATK